MAIPLCAIESAATPFGRGLFRYAQFGHSLYADVHPNFVNVPVAWRHSATYGLMCEYEMPPKVLRFLNALVDTFRGENVERERRMP